MKKPKTSNRDRGYTNLLHHLSKHETKRDKQYEKIERLLLQLMATTDDISKKEDQLMQTIADKATEVQNHIDQLNQLIQSGNADPAALQAIADKLDAANAAVLNIDPVQAAARKAKKK